MKPLSAAEVLDVADLRLTLISLALEPAHRHLSPADFDHTYDLANRITQTNNAKALWAFKKIYLEVVDQLVDHLKSRESEDSSSLKG